VEACAGEKRGTTSIWIVVKDVKGTRKLQKKRVKKAWGENKEVRGKTKTSPEKNGDQKRDKKEELGWSGKWGGKNSEKEIRGEK